MRHVFVHVDTAETRGRINATKDAGLNEPPSLQASDVLQDIRDIRELGRVV